MLKIYIQKFLPGFGKVRSDGSEADWFLVGLYTFQMRGERLRCSFLKALVLSHSIVTDKAGEIE